MSAYAMSLKNSVYAGLDFLALQVLDGGLEGEIEGLEDGEETGGV